MGIRGTPEPPRLQKCLVPTPERPVHPKSGRETGIFRSSRLPAWGCPRPGPLPFCPCRAHAGPSPQPLPGLEGSGSPLLTGLCLISGKEVMGF